MAVDGDKLGMESRRLVPAVQFGLWFFAFMLLESFVNRSVATLLGAQTVNAAYSLGIFCTATGLLAFGLAQSVETFLDWCNSFGAADLGANLFNEILENLGMVHFE